jgi:hypothetical protein
MHGMPPATEPLSRNFLDETIVRVRADEKERETERQAK